MVKEFLLNYQQNLVSSKIETEEELDLVQTKIRENEKFLAMLQSENDSLFTDFSPREVEGKHKNRIRELNETLQNQYDVRLALTNKVNDIDRKLIDIEEVIKVAEGLTEPTVLARDDEVTLNHTSDETQDLVKSGIHRAIDCLPADPLRAKIELQNLLKKYF